MKKIITAITIFTILLSITILVMHPQPARAQSEPQRLRIGVIQDGIVRVTPADLKKAGLDPASVDPRTFALSSHGQDVAIFVQGEADGSFDPEDYIEFFGQKFHSTIQDEKYTDENVYWLMVGGEPGPRMAEKNAAPSFKLSSPTDFAATVHAEENNYWFTQKREGRYTDDTWFWEILRPNTKNGFITDTFPSFIPYPAPNSPATLIVEEYSQTQAQHRTIIELNDQQLLDEKWEGTDLKTFTATVPANLVTHGVNTVTIGAVLSPNDKIDKIFVNHWDLHYRRSFKAWQGQIDFHTEENGPHEYLIKGWDETKVEILDVSNPLAPRRLTHPATIPGRAKAILFRVQDKPGDHFWLQEEQKILSPHTIKLRPPQPELRQPSQGADVIIVTGPELEPAARRLQEWHQQRGYQSRIVFFQDLVDEFDDGIYHPRAVVNFMNWARANWPDPKPHYLVLFGDGHWNFKGYATDKYKMEPIIVPPYLAWEDPWQGEVPDDNRFADLDGDGNPELAVGRIPVSNLKEANAVVDKLISYNENERDHYWQRRAIFVADYDPQAGDFARLSEKIITKYIPSDIIVKRIYRNFSHIEAEDVRVAINTEINRGVGMVQYAGHGSPTTWMKGEGWSLKDIAHLENHGKYPVVFSFNCLDGYFAYPGTPGIAEFMLRQNNAGSIAAISPTGLGVTSIQTQFRETLLEILFKEDVHVLGDALLMAKQRFYEERGKHYIIETMTLFGDPTLRFPAAARPFLLRYELNHPLNPFLSTPGKIEIYAK